MDLKKLSDGFEFHVMVVGMMTISIMEGFMLTKEVIDNLIVLLEVLRSLENNHKKVLESILDDIDLSDSAYEQVVRESEALLKESVF